jgi:uncharacterized protein YbaP (TraB family)
MVAILIAAALAAASPPGAPASLEAPAEPAIFVVRDADTTVYLFGTFHALDGKSCWLSGPVKQAFEQSSELVLETLIPEGPPSAAPPAPAPRALRNWSATPSASFLATTRMAINAGRSQGMQVANGADMVLRRDAEAEGKSVEGLETLQLQLNMFARMSQPAAPAKASGAETMGSLSRSMAEMQDAWKHGDQSVFVRMLSELESTAPETYRLMFTERNARWADWIRARMQTPGTVFVAVGAGHLAGKDSVLVQLAQRGIPSARVY